MRSNIHTLMQDTNDCDRARIGFVNDEMRFERKNEIAGDYVVDIAALPGATRQFRKA
ncbi:MULTISPECIES: hypothetical protein [unclassified Rhizobium]|uniref:hypothetical protein n=1 Tax=unclassified Rhizobium TaxID=2613769 RepID=UPI001FFDF0E7|nr:MULTISPECIES: hypothetical protein [unclassified Rhizobium]